MSAKEIAKDSSSSKPEKSKRRFGGWVPVFIVIFVLTVVYQWGHSSGSRSSLHSHEPINVTRPIPMDVSPERPVGVPIHTNTPRSNTQPSRPQPVPSTAAVPANTSTPRSNTQVVRSQPIPLEGSTPSTANPAHNNIQVIRRQPIAVDASVQDVSSVPVIRPQVERIPAVIESSDLLTPMSYTGAPATNVSHPAPIQSVYDPRPVTPMNPSESSFVPLRPLAPATVYQPSPLTPSSAAQATFRAPVLPPPSPVPATPAPAARIVSPFSFNCDCGQEH